jgi:XRE family transcriptional regulator, regulator of sulfur utilization
MKPEYQKLRLRQLTHFFETFEAARNYPRPSYGWLRAVREALGLTLNQVGQNMHASRQRIKNFEDAERQDRITLASLRRVAEAMGCELVYAIVPKSGSFAELAERPTRERAARDVKSVLHTMALEGQKPENVGQLTEDEVQRRLSHKPKLHS